MRRLLVSLSLLLIACCTFAQLNGKFSVSATKQVQFSRGNLVYNGSSKSFSFATNQYSMIGSGNQSISSTYSGSIDLFGWGTSGYNNCMPYETSLSVIYGGGGSSIAGTQYDWGVKNFTNYRTLTNEEWSYILSGRANASELRGPAQVNGTNGWILLPDNWTTPSGITFKSVFGGASGYSSNSYTSSQFTTLQNAGAVFLPAAGWRYSSGSSTVVSYSNSMGYYWSATSGKAITFGGTYCYSGENAATYSGCAVRLVYDSSGGGGGGQSDSYTITTAVSPAGAGTITGAGTYKNNAQATFKATASGEYKFYRFEFDADNTYSTNNPWTFYVRKSGKVTAVFKKKGYPVFGVSANPDLGTVTPDYYSEPKGTVVTFTAVPMPGCRFVQWEDGVTTATRNYTIKGTETDANPGLLRATFESVNSYTLTVSSAQTTMGSVSTGQSSNTYKAGQSVRIMATPKNGYKFVCWNNEPTNKSNPKSFNIYGDSTYVAYFDVAQKVQITVLPDDEGICTVTGGGEYDEQQSVTIRAYVPSGKKFASWWYYNTSTDTWKFVDSKNPYTFIAKSNWTFKAAIVDAKPVTVNVTSADEEQGRVSVTPEKDIYYEGDTIYIQAYPDPCYEFKQWSDNYTNSLRQIILSKSIDIQGTFLENKKQVYISTNNSSAGSVRIVESESGQGWSSNDEIWGCPGTPLTLEAQSKDNYEFDHWTDGSTENPRTYLIPNENIALRAYFTKVTFGGYCGYNPKGTTVSIYPPTEDAWWTYNGFNVIRIEGKGPLYEYGYKYDGNFTVSGAPWYELLKSADTPFTLVIKDSITTIPSQTFNSCKGLTRADLSQSAIHTIESSSFQYCSNLSEVTLPDSLLIIKNSVFNSTGIESVILPPQLKEIGGKAFYDCKKLNKIIFTNPTPAKLNYQRSLYDYPICFTKTDTIFVPSGCRQAYINGGYLSGSVKYIIEWHAVDLSVIGQGTCKVDAPTYIIAGDKVQLNPVAAEDWELDEILLIDQLGNIQTIDEPYLFEMPESNVTVRVKFKEIVPSLIQEIEQPVASARAVKVIIDKRIYIMRNGILYDLNGKIAKHKQ